MSLGDKNLNKVHKLKGISGLLTVNYAHSLLVPKDNSNQQFLKQKKTIIYRSKHFSFGDFPVNQQVMQGKVLQIPEVCRSFRGH